MTDSDEPLKRVAILLEGADLCQQQGRIQDAENLIAEAKHLAAGNRQACAEIDLFLAISLLNANKREEGVRNLSAILVKYADWFKNPDSRDVYEIVQLQRAFSLVHLQRNEEALPLLEEALSFQLEIAVQSDLHCQLGRCYHELAQYHQAKVQFERADVLGVGEDWRSTYHYYFGYTLFQLRDFQQAKRQFIMCLQSGDIGPPESMRYAMLAATCRKLGEHSEAALYQEKTKSLRP